MAAAAAAATQIFVYVYDQGRIYKQQIVPSIVAETPVDGHKTKSSFRDYIMSIRALACVGSVSESYIAGRFGKNNILIAMGTEQDVEVRGKIIKDIHPFGFVMANFESADKDLYIDVICSAPFGGVSYGNQMLQYIVSMAQTKGCPSVMLNSLPSVLTYYPKYGFKFRKNCEAPLVEYEGSVLQRKAMELAAVRSLPKSSADAYHIKEYVDFMKLLHTVDLNKKKDGPCGKGNAITLQNIRDSDCGMDGYTMTKCFTHGGHRRRQTMCRRLNRRKEMTRRRS